MNSLNNSHFAQQLLDRVNVVEKRLEQNTADTEEILAIVKGFKGIMLLSRWAAALITGAAAVWATLHLPGK